MPLLELEHLHIVRPMRHSCTGHGMHESFDGAAFTIDEDAVRFLVAHEPRRPRLRPPMYRSDDPAGALYRRIERIGRPNRVLKPGDRKLSVFGDAHLGEGTRPFDVPHFGQRRDHATAMVVEVRFGAPPAIETSNLPTL